MTKPISNLLATAKYKHADLAKSDILVATKYFTSLAPRLERYTYPTGVSRELICLDGTIPVNIRGAKYNIPIGVFLSDVHPLEAPICYVRPTRDMTIKTSMHVDGSGRVYMPYLSQWHKNRSDILGAIQSMQIVFGLYCPVYQKVKEDNDTAASSNVAMPPSLPSSYYPNKGGSASDNNTPSGSNTISMPTPPNPVYPFSSQPQPYSSTSSGATGTITEEHIRASLLSAVEDRLRYRFKEKILQLQDEIQVLKKTSSDLDKGKSQLDEMKSRMAREFAELTEAKKKLQELDDQLQEFIVKYDKDNEDVNPDEVYGPSQPLYKQLLEAFAEDNAIIDAIYYTGEGLRKGVIPLDVFLKSVRELSRRQFMQRALMRACRTEASLPN